MIYNQLEIDYEKPHNMAQLHIYFTKIFKSKNKRTVLKRKKNGKNRCPDTNYEDSRVFRTIERIKTYFIIFVLIFYLTTKQL